MSNLASAPQCSALGSSSLDDLKLWLAAELHHPSTEIDDETNLLMLGLDSLRAMECVNRLRVAGHCVTLKQLLANPSLSGWSCLIEDAQCVETHPAIEVLPSWPNLLDGAPFPLTEVQHAYLVGRGPTQPLGAVGCHLYQEFDGVGLTSDTLNRVVSELVQRHPMLNTAIQSDGQQKWIETPVWSGARVHDLRDATPEQTAEHFAMMRSTLGHRILDVEKGACFDFQLTRLPDHRHCLHVNLDLLVLDAASFSILFTEMAALIEGRPLPRLSRDYDFRAYLAQSALSQDQFKDRARLFWHKRLRDLPPAPALPVVENAMDIGRLSRHRRRHVVNPQDWARFSGEAMRRGYTPTMALATAFAIVMSRWSHQPRLLLNVPIFDRQPYHPDVKSIIGDFTKIILVDMAAEGACFADLVQENIDTFTTSWEYRDYSGVEILRDLRKLGQHPHGAPVVFTGTLSEPLFGLDPESTIGTPTWGVSQTPQVSIDHLAFRLNGSVCLQWDSADALFPAGLIDSMFQAYIAFVSALAANRALWDQALPDMLPEGQRRIRAEINSVHRSISQACLHDAFYRMASAQPHATAIIHNGQETTYAELEFMARKCARHLLEFGVEPGERVAICMECGVGHVVTTLAILSVGAAYVPLACDQPEDRLNAILHDAGIRVILTSPSFGSQISPVMIRIPWEKTQISAPLDELINVPCGSLAYVIYTSGSTGMPKGVMISHRAALNTCADINGRIALSPSDRVLALSALHFDLSVYDIFGTLSAGAAIIMIDEEARRDPDIWCTLIKDHRISVWNSVPSLFDMLLTYAEGFAIQAPTMLRAVLLSGDWIGLDLPERYRAFNAQGRLLALGGATEASIWSNLYEIVKIDPSWRSVPYGRPLTNQKFRVADFGGRDCPDWVPGELWIGGAGVATGYLNDPMRTDAQFVRYLGETWYKTGDIGRYWPDGTLEFLGRRDGQVKIGGYRIELGEIDAGLASIRGIKQSLTLATHGQDKSLISFLIPETLRTTSSSPDTASNLSSYEDCFPPLQAMPPYTEREEACADIRDFVASHLGRFEISLDILSDPVRACQIYGATPRYVSIFKQWSELCAKVTRPVEVALPLFETLHRPLRAILTGASMPEILLNDLHWAPETRMLAVPGTQESLNWLASSLPKIARKLERAPLIVEIGARSGMTAEFLMRAIRGANVTYIATDESPEMICRAETRLQGMAGLRCMRWGADTRSDLFGQADIVLANNALHRLGASGMDALVSVARPGAMVFVIELAEMPPIACVSADLLNSGHSLADRIALLTTWRERFEKRGFIFDAAERIGDQNCLILRWPHAVPSPDANMLRILAAKKLPEYMIPRQIRFLDAWPLTPNGKIDHAALLQMAGSVETCHQKQHALSEPLDAVEECVLTLWKSLLKTENVSRDSHFFSLGGDSLLATRLIGALSQKGYTAPLNKLFEHPVLCDFAATLTRETCETEILQPDRVNRFAPFPLSEIQQAYLVGRQTGFTLGGVGSHFFMEFDVDDLNVERFELDVNRLIARHDMLRCVVSGSQQRVLEHVPKFKLHRRIFPSFEAPELAAWRKILSQQVLNPETWPVFDIRAATCGGNMTRIFMTLDNLMLDGMSMQIFLAELDDLYGNRASLQKDPDVTFRDFIIYKASRKPDALSRAYWQSRLPLMPPAPPLPIIRDPSGIGHPVFQRLTSRLVPKAWSQLKDQAAHAGVSPSTVLLTAFCVILSRWSGAEDFTLNLTLFDRPPIHPHIDRILGDFTSLLLLEWSPQVDWTSSLVALQHRLGQDLAHRDVSAIWVMRQLAASRGQASVSMPVVFTSAIGVSDGRFLSERAFLKPRGGISQTPQIWLDHQVYEVDGALHFNWDVVAALFDPSDLETAFNAYCGLLGRLVEEPALWNASLAGLVDIELSSPLKKDVAFSDLTPSSIRIGHHRGDVQPEFLSWLCRAFKLISGCTISPQQNFFDSGGTSLHLIQFHKILRDAGHLDLTVTDLFSHTSPLMLARHLSKTRETAPQAVDTRRARRDQRRVRKNLRAHDLSLTDLDDCHD